ncbi:MAG: hypothetical protein IME94_00375 [Proteobacteria bacterium]|nr:hypothetical protein [Pseudomonadota bacterium]
MILLIISLLGLSACSPHSGAGTWITDGNNPLKLTKIVVVFEGTADFFSEKNKETDNSAIRRCFWSTAAEDQLQMQCVHADNTDLKETYQFTIIEGNQAQLTQNKQLIALFKKQTP